MPKPSSIEVLPQAVKEWLDRSLVENSFSGYQALEAELKERGYTISKSAIHRYGQNFEKRLAAVKMATEQAKAIVDGVPDDEGKFSEALMRLAQEKIFGVLMDFEPDPDKPMNLSSLAKAAAELSRASVTQKKWAAEVKSKMAAKFAELERESEAGKRSFDAETLRIVREEIYGIVS